MRIKDRFSRTLLVIGTVLLFVASIQNSNAESWKGVPAETEISLGALAGVGVVDGYAGVGLMGNFAKKIVHQGFIPELNNQVFVEAEFGPIFLKPKDSMQTSWGYSLHLRWDFQKDLNWTLYAIGGLGGVFTSEDLGKRAELYPRFGVGAFLYLRDEFSLRGEISHEFTAIGASFHL